MERNNFEGASNSSKLDFHEISTAKGIVESKEKYVYRKFAWNKNAPLENISPHFSSLFLEWA